MTQKTVARVFSVLLVVALLLAAAGFFAYRHFTAPTGAGKFTLEVTPGMSVGTIASTLEQKGIVRNSDVFRLVLKQRGTSSQIQEGIYDFDGSRDIFGVAETLEKGGRPRVINVTIPEGRRVKDIVKIVAAAGISNEQELKKAFETTFEGLPRTSNEGYLFPATYPFRPETTAAEVLKALVQRMEKELTPQRVEQAKKLGLTVHEWLTLASIVQAEAANTGEMPLIAGLFLNRMEIGMPLQSDPTIAYGLGKDLPQLDRSAGDFQKDTPYNSYTRRELPPTPINNPGVHALMSVLNSERLIDGRKAFYFVHGRDGKIHVNSDFGSHLRDVDRYR